MVVTFRAGSEAVEGVLSLTVGDLTAQVKLKGVGVPGKRADQVGLQSASLGRVHFCSWQCPSGRHATAGEQGCPSGVGSWRHVPWKQKFTSVQSPGPQELESRAGPTPQPARASHVATWQATFGEGQAWGV